MDQSNLPLTQADMALLRSFLNRIPASLPTGIGAAAAPPGPVERPNTSHGASLSQNTQASLHIRPYQGTVSRGASSGGTPAASNQTTLSNFAAFQGIRSLGSGVSRQVVDQQRRASAAATLPRQPPLQRRASRRSSRGTAIAPPGISSAPTMQNAVIPVEDGSLQLRIKVKVYPPKQNPSDDLVLYRSYIDSFNSFLESHFLLMEYEMSGQSTISDVINKAADDMRNCPLQYRFSTRFPRNIMRHEALPLRLLCLVNRGRMRQSDNQIHLQRAPLPGTTPISALFGNGISYANPRLCLEGNRFVIYFVVAHDPFSALLPCDDSDISTRRHKCLSMRTYRQFPFDGYVGMEDDSSDPYESSGGETDSSDECNSISGSEESDSDEVTPTPRPSNQPQRHMIGVRNTHPIRPSVIAPTSNSRNDNSQQGSGPSSSVRMVTSTAAITPGPPSLPLSIWTTSWSPPTVDNRIENLETVEDVVRYVADASGNASRTRLCLRGRNVQDLAYKLRAEIELAAATKDFSSILSPNREFIVEGEDHTIRSLGSGIEAEVLFTAFSQLQENPGQWLLPRVDDTASIAVMHTFSAACRLQNNSSRLRGMYVFGALTALLISQGVPPLPLSPVLLQFIVYNCDLHALHSDLITEWHPELASTIKQWINIGPSGSISSFQGHFSTWHESQIGLFADRDECSHSVLAAEMLYRAIIGNEPPEHPELQQFIEGFKLPCANGFNFIKASSSNSVLKSFSGGAELYFSIIWTSQIKSFTDIAPYIQYRNAPSSLVHLAFSAFSSTDVEQSMLQDVISGFLKRTGIPCPKKFEEARSHFSDIIDFKKIEDPAFRSRMFCWAATGCPSFVADSGDITIYLVGENDANYGHPAYRDAMLGEGKVSFKTCSRQVRIPASYFAKLSHEQYDASKEPQSLQDAVDDWLLCEILNAIGGHSIL